MVGKTTLINSAPNLHLWGTDWSVWLSVENVTYAKHAAKKKNNLSQITCLSITLENRHVVHVCDANREGTLSVVGRDGSFSGTKFTSNICDCTHEYNFEKQAEERYKQGCTNRKKKAPPFFFLCVCANGIWKADSEHATMFAGGRSSFALNKPKCH